MLSIEGSANRNSIVVKRKKNKNNRLNQMKLVNLTVSTPDVTLIQTFTAPFHVLRKLSAFLITNECESTTFQINDKTFTTVYENVNVFISEDATVLDAFETLSEAGVTLTSFDIIHSIQETETTDANFRAFYEWWEQNQETTISE